MEAAQPRAQRRRTRQALRDPEVYAASLAALHAAQARDQALTLPHADRNGHPWTPEEDALVLARRVKADWELASHLVRRLRAAREVAQTRRVLNVSRITQRA